jgi:Ca2+/Na+ antiporter
MDPGTLGGLLGAIVGSVLGIMGGCIGTYFTIKNTNGPRERAFTIKASIFCWIFVVSFIAGMLLIPFWYKMLLWIPYAIFLMFGIRKWNQIQFRIREEESGHSVKS